MMVVNCPSCGQPVLLPEQTAGEIRVRCPLCLDEYPLITALAELPPALIVVEPASEEHFSDSLFGDATRPLVHDPALPASPVLKEFQFETSPPPSLRSQRSRSARAVRRHKNPLGEVLKIVAGGVVGLAIGQAILWWVLDRDPLDAGPVAAKIAPWAVPPALRGALAGNLSASPSATDQAGMNSKAGGRLASKPATVAAQIPLQASPTEEAATPQEPPLIRVISEAAESVDTPDTGPTNPAEELPVETAADKPAFEAAVTDVGPPALDPVAYDTTQQIPLASHLTDSAFTDSRDAPRANLDPADSAASVAVDPFSAETGSGSADPAASESESSLTTSRLPTHADPTESPAANTLGLNPTDSVAAELEPVDWDRVELSESVEEDGTHHSGLDAAATATSVELAKPQSSLALAGAMPLDATALAERLEVSLVALQLWDQAGDVGRAEHRRLAADLYRSVAEIGGEMAVSEFAEAAGESLLLRIRELVQTLTTDEAKRSLVEHAGPSWIAAKGAGHGVLMLGVVQSFTARGGQWEIDLELHGGRVEKVVSAAPVNAIVAGDRVAVLGRIVAAPRESLVGYTGAAQRLVFSCYHYKVPAMGSAAQPEKAISTADGVADQ